MVATQKKSKHQPVLAAVAPTAPVSDVQPVSRPDTLATLPDKELGEMLKALKAEQKRRDEANSAHRPTMGERVLITGGPKDRHGQPYRFIGREGTAVIVRKSRAFVAIDGITNPQYILITDLQRKGKAS